MNNDNITADDIVNLVNSGKLSDVAKAIQPPEQLGSEQKQSPVPAGLPAEAITPTTEQSYAKETKETPGGLLTPTRATGFDIKDPVELLFLLDESIASGTVKLHDWQIQFMIDFARDEHTKDKPFQAEVQACNGSGKDKYVVAACAVWLCMRYMQSRCVVTNGSGVQLDNQTELYIRLLCTTANTKIAPNIWKCNYRYYECLATGSPMTLFATDEPNKAEGYHPLVAGAKMAVFASEAKAIPDEIFTALERCSGFTHRVDVSTPGLPMGYFYETCSTALDRKSITDIKELSSTQFLLYKITAYECSHISSSEIERIASKLPGGKNSPVFKSSILAEFGTTDEMVVVPYTYIWQAVNNKIEHIKEDFNTAGLDLSDGGAETALTIRNGNKHVKTEPFRFDNTEDTIAFLNERFRYYELDNPNSHINADCSGMGKPMLDRMKRQGWVNIRYVNNGAKAFEWRTYANRGTETWFHIRRLLELREIIVISEKELVRQLSTRYYKITPKNLHQLLSKLEQRSRGYPSPDRADSFVLAFSDYKSVFKEVITDDTKPFKPAEMSKPVSEFNLNEWAKRETGKEGMLNPSKNKDFSVYKRLIANHNKQITKSNEQEN